MNSKTGNSIERFKQTLITNRLEIFLGACIVILMWINHWIDDDRKATVARAERNIQQDRIRDNIERQVMPNSIETRLRDMQAGRPVLYREPTVGNLTHTADLRDTVNIIVNYTQIHPEIRFTYMDYICARTIRIFGPNNRYFISNRNSHDQDPNNLLNQQEEAVNPIPLITSLNEIETALANRYNPRNPNNPEILSLQTRRESLRNQIIDNSFLGNSVLDLHADSVQEMEDLEHAETSFANTVFAAQQLAAEYDQANLTGLNPNFKIDPNKLVVNGLKAAIKDTEKHWNYFGVKIRRPDPYAQKKPRSASMIDLYSGMYSNNNNNLAYGNENDKPKKSNDSRGPKLVNFEMDENKGVLYMSPEFYNHYVSDESQNKPKYIKKEYTVYQYKDNPAFYSNEPNSGTFKEPIRKVFDVSVEEARKQTIYEELNETESNLHPFNVLNPHE